MFGCETRIRARFWLMLTTECQHPNQLHQPDSFGLLVDWLLLLHTAQVRLSAGERDNEPNGLTSRSVFSILGYKASLNCKKVKNKLLLLDMILIWGINSNPLILVFIFIIKIIDIIFYSLQIEFYMRSLEI